MINNQKGVALIQILIIVAILSVFSLYITQTARQQIRMAAWAQDRAIAEVALHSAEAELLFNLLTEDKLPNSNNVQPNPLLKIWNFYNKPFEFNKVVHIKIQDQAGLINLHTIHQGRFRKLLLKNKVSEQRVEQILDHLLDWQDTDNITRPNGAESVATVTKVRNGPIPDISELNHIVRLTATEQTLLFENVGIFFFGDFNPMTASIALISGLSNNSAAQQIEVLRNDNQLTINNFVEITNIEEDDDMRFYPSNVMAVTYMARVNEVFVTREIVISLSPYAKNANGPINMLLDRR